MCLYVAIHEADATGSAACHLLLDWCASLLDDVLMFCLLHLELGSDLNESLTDCMFLKVTVVSISADLTSVSLFAQALQPA